MPYTKMEIKGLTIELSFLLAPFPCRRSKSAWALLGVHVHWVRRLTNQLIVLGLVGNTFLPRMYTCFDKASL